VTSTPNNVSFVFRINGGSWVYVNNQTVGNKPSSTQLYNSYMNSFIVGDTLEFGILNGSGNNITFGLGNNSGTYTGYCGLISYYTYTIPSTNFDLYINIQDTGSGYVIC
jgi:hypothetical protein